MPTDDTQETEDTANASGDTASAEVTTPELTDDQIKALPKEKLESHPYIQELKDKHAAARKGMDKANKKLKEVKKPDESDEAEAIPDAEDDTLWLIENAPSLKMVGAEYRNYRAKGYDRDDALRLAKMDKGIVKTESDSQRQSSSVSSTTVNRKSEPEITLTPEQVERGITVEMVKKYQDQLGDVG